MSSATIASSCSALSSTAGARAATDAFEDSVGLTAPSLPGERIGVRGEVGGEAREERGGGVQGAAGGVGVARGKAFNAFDEICDEGELREGGLKRYSGSAEGDRAIGVEGCIVWCCASGIACRLCGSTDLTDRLVATSGGSGVMA